MMARFMGEQALRPLHFYLLGTGSWFLAFGIQGVMFAWLVTMVLNETPERVGVAQMSLLLPGTVLILIGGSQAHLDILTNADLSDRVIAHLVQTRLHRGTGRI